MYNTILIYSLIPIIGGIFLDTSTSFILSILYLIYNPSINAMQLFVNVIIKYMIGVHYVLLFELLLIMRITIMNNEHIKVIDYLIRSMLPQLNDRLNASRQLIDKNIEFIIFFINKLKHTEHNEYNESNKTEEGYITIGENLDQLDLLPPELMNLPNDVNMEEFIKIMAHIQNMYK